MRKHGNTDATLMGLIGVTAAILSLPFGMLCFAVGLAISG